MKNVFNLYTFLVKNSIATAIFPMQEQLQMHCHFTSQLQLHLASTQKLEEQLQIMGFSHELDDDKLRQDTTLVKLDLSMWADSLRGA